MESDLFRRYLDSLPPDDRITAERAYEDDPLFRQAIHESEGFSDEQMKVLSAEWEEYSESGDVASGSMLEGLLGRAREEEQAAARARVVEAEGRSPVARYLGRSRGYRMSGPLEKTFASVAPLDQALLYRLYDLYGELAFLAEAGGELALTRMRTEGRDLIPVEQATDRASYIPLVAFVEMCGRVLDAVEEQEPHEWVHLRPELVEDARRLREFLRRWGVYYTGRITNGITDMLVAELSLNDHQWTRLHRAVRAWQRLMWTAECLQHGGIYFGGRPEPLPRDQNEAGPLLTALGDLLEPMVNAPALVRALPKRADAFLYRRHATKALLDSIAIRRERELAAVFATDIREHRHYTLDHIARVELGGRYNVERVTLAPEQRGPNGPLTGFIVEHRRGAIVGTTFLTEPGTDWSAVTYLDGFEQALEDAPDTPFEELVAPLTMLVLAAWRNLVVPRVRDEQYEVTVRRKPKATGNRPARQARRADVAVVDYLPRTLVYRRMEETARRERGDDAPLRVVYRVGNFARRLPDGEQRSPEADAYAKEIGMPLAPWQTVVRAHWRGGTPEEREAAEQAGEVPIREWRSWDALDLLAT